MEVYIIYGITDCPACLRACADLMDLELEYVFVETDFSPTYRENLKKELKWSTFPIILKVTEDGESLVGGYDDLIYELTGAPANPV